MKILLLIFCFSNFVFAQSSNNNNLKNSDDKEIEQIDDLIQDAKEEIQMNEVMKEPEKADNEKSNVQTTKFGDNSSSKETETLNSSAFGADTYNLDDDKKDLAKATRFPYDEFNENENYSGQAGSWLFNLLYESASYDGYKRQHGFELEYAWIYDLRYIAFHVLGNFGNYRGPLRATGFFPLGLGAEVLIGVPSWFFVSAYYGMEYAKQESNSDYFTFNKASIGVYFDLSTISKESQFELYRSHQIRRTYLIVKYNQRSNNDLAIYAKKSICLGLGFEY